MITAGPSGKQTQFGDVECLNNKTFSDLSLQVGSQQRQLLSQLQEHEMIVVDGIFPYTQWNRWAQVAESRRNEGQYQRAKIGRGLQSEQSLIRSDSTLWLASNDLEMVGFQNWITSFQQIAREEFFLPLRSHEFHFAHYSSGAHYDAHLDQSPVADLLKGRRIVTFILYLNQAWQEHHGGHLVIYPRGTSQQDWVQAKRDRRVLREQQKIAPLGGRMVLFLSDSLLHEVQVCHSDRSSLTGWFRDDLANS